ncbi:YaeQ family protein [Ideonella sp. A 288]|uniref:YaeQ family protein n=1 Tax=Ideonella sp. A 288 TaxID=1962181 RepID=UPI000B4B2271|nr:YaeQ family protein [Ideonella sp. A 288]
MAIKSTIYKASLQIADMDRQVYGDHALTLALHPSETEERMMIRLLAFALHVPANDDRGMLQFARGLSDTEEPDLWQRDLTDQLIHWIEVGQPDDRRMSKACGRAERVTIYCYSSSAHIWWAGLETKVTRLRNLEVWRIEAEQSQALTALAKRSMQLQVTTQDAHTWVSDGTGSVEIRPVPLWRGGN